MGNVHALFTIRKLSHYTPDFWLEEHNVYLEVKGYETDLDRCKWSQFTAPLIVWKKAEINKIRLDTQVGEGAYLLNK